MKEKKVYVVTDLGPGDGGKGGAVHKLCTFKKAHTVIKVGGAQGSHGVRTSKGQSFNFSQFGCGTFEGIPTYVSKRMVIEPFCLIEEGKQLMYEWGIKNAFDLIVIDEDALCVTPFHTAMSRLRELARKGNPKGTVGMGIGEAFHDYYLHPELAIRAKDFGAPGLRQKVENIRNRKLLDLDLVIRGEVFPEDMLLFSQQLDILNDKSFIDKTVDTFNMLGKMVKIVDQEYFQKEVLSRDGVIVVESSHGILTDRYHGFHPHTTKLRTIPQVTLDLLEENGYDGKIIKLGLTRGYQIRHGAGPMVTESPELLEQLLPGSHKDDNRWQGKVRVGSLDLVSLKYAIDVCGGPTFFDGLIITWFDQIQKVGRWDVCTEYRGADNRDFFTNNDEIRVVDGIDGKLWYQEELTKQLLRCNPGITTYDVQGMSQDSLTELCSAVLEDALHVPVKMISFGPTEKEKVLI